MGKLFFEKLGALIKREPTNTEETFCNPNVARAKALADAGADLEHKLRATKKGIKIIQNAKVLGGLEINIYVHTFENGAITTHPESFNVDVETQNKILDLLEEQYGKEYMRLKQEYWNL